MCNKLQGKHNVWFWSLRYRANQPWLINFLWFRGTVLPQQILYFPRSYSLHMHTFMSARQSSFHSLILFYLQSFYPYKHLLYRGADKSLARPGRKQASISVRMVWVSFGAFPCREKKTLDDSSRLDVVEIARVPDMPPSLLPSWSG